jgi:hypothetical protein
MQIISDKPTKYYQKRPGKIDCSGAIYYVMFLFRKYGSREIATIIA